MRLYTLTRVTERASEAPNLGAYGFRIIGLEGFEQLLVTAEAAWPPLEVVWREEPALPAGDVPEGAQSIVRFTSGGAVLELGPSSRITIERDPQRATIVSAATASGHAVVHPFLGGAASIVARWHGWESLHAGAFLMNGKAWGVLGERAAGKSSLLALLHLRGRSVLADDILVIERGTVFAAPRSLDLRRETAERYGAGDHLGRVGARERWRVGLGPVPNRATLGGWIHLAWGDRVEVKPVHGHGRLTRLAAQLTIPDVPADAAALLELAALPSVELRRPRDWVHADVAADALLAVLA